MKIRAIKTTDLKEWARLRQSLWPECTPARSRVEMRELLGDAEKFGVLVLECEGGRLGGFVELALRDGVDGAKAETTAFLEGWLVELELRGAGWGRKLIAAAGRWARARGMRELASDAELDDAGAIAAHRALGFRETFRVMQFLKPLRPTRKAAKRATIALIERKKSRLARDRRQAGTSRSTHRANYRQEKVIGAQASRPAAARITARE